MTVRIRETAYQTASGHTYQVRRDEVRGHLMIIASGGTGDLEPSFGDRPDPSDGSYSIVAYDPSPPPDAGTPSGRVRIRLKTLVDSAGRFDVIGVAGDTIWSDGTTVEAQPAFTLGNTVFYDTSTCNGRGRWVRGVNGEQECTPAAVILYHELAHAFHGHGAGDVAQEEAEAIDDENDLRGALGLVLRNRDRLEGGCGCADGGCCIVASVAYGSPYAREINLLRWVRDRTLRTSRLGGAFFDALHDEYYAFSVAIARLMVRSPAARSNVERWLVRPLASVLALLVAYRQRPTDLEQLGRRFLEQLPAAAPAAPGGAGRADWAALRRFLDALAGGAVPEQAGPLLDPSSAEVCRILARWLPQSPHVTWGILGPLRVYLDAGARFARDSAPEVVGAWLAERFDAWLARLPLEQALAEVPAERRAAELAALGQSLFRDEEKRQALVERLSARVSSPGGPRD